MQLPQQMCSHSTRFPSMIMTQRHRPVSLHCLPHQQQFQHRFFSSNGHRSSGHFGSSGELAAAVGLPAKLGGVGYGSDCCVRFLHGRRAVVVVVVVAAAGEEDEEAQSAPVPFVWRWLLLLLLFLLLLMLSLLLLLLLPQPSPPPPPRDLELLRPLLRLSARGPAAEDGHSEAVDAGGASAQ